MIRASERASAAVISRNSKLIVKSLLLSRASRGQEPSRFFTVRVISKHNEAVVLQQLLEKN
jgi:hypothetical protein